MNNSVRKITYGGVMAAFILLATRVITIPIPNNMGYFNFGDGSIFAAAVVLGPFAAIPAGIGSALSDLLTPPYGIYAPATFIIKGLMGLLSGYVLMKRPKLPIPLQALLLITCELIMIFGYFAFEALMYGVPAAIPQLLTNGLQGVAGVILGLAMMPLARRIPQITRISR